MRVSSTNGFGKGDLVFLREYWVFHRGGFKLSQVAGMSDFWRDCWPSIYVGLGMKWGMGESLGTLGVMKEGQVSKAWELTSSSSQAWGILGGGGGGGGVHRKSGREGCEFSQPLRKFLQKWVDSAKLATKFCSAKFVAKSL